MVSKRIVIGISAWLFAWSTTATSAEGIDHQEIKQYQQQLERLDKVNFHPNLLPLILKHKDYLELTPEQIAAFRAWREKNAKSMIAAMDEIIRARIAFREAALSPDVSADDLRQKQRQIFALHQQVLDYKLSCRENILNTFNAQNWEDFFVVLAEEGYAIPTSSASSRSNDVVGLSELEQ
ncbi:MAG: hypothetical protein HKP12_05490 [Gammaproteobacteria bacterium]|nr:hypothetical protein [Gammaproteobacteria bacterium]